jgi:hypothetical protein
MNDHQAVRRARSPGLPPPSTAPLPGTKPAAKLQMSDAAGPFLLLASLLASLSSGWTGGVNS